VSVRRLSVTGQQPPVGVPLEFSVSGHLQFYFTGINPPIKTKLR